MPSSSAEKGKRGERELATTLAALLGVPSRRGKQYAGDESAPDVIVDLPGIHWECKRVERLHLKSAMEQAAKDAGQGIPVVASRANGEPWMFSCRLDDLPRLAELVYLARAEHA